ncbi:MAG: tetraacyldisaccharide 4'-kinase [Rubrivivax sp.]|nr:tetraacyldisaccharide 4'-kinase [Rubrivivax sp.]
MRGALARAWWRERPGWLAWLLSPLAALYGALAARRARTAPAWSAPCPIVVVGNLVVGGAGKTPTVIALVYALRERGYTPGVVSRGYGRRTRGVQAVTPDRRATEVGDEPWLIARSTGAPVVVGEQRVAAAQALLREHPAIDLIVADDGLQHAALPRDAEVWVFDERGIGNGCLLPAGPLRQRLPPRLPPQALVLYNAPRASTRLPGTLARRQLAGAVALPDWARGAGMQAHALRALAGRRLLAIAGIATPERFFAMLRAQGLDVEELPLADHAPLDRPPWPPGTAEVLCTEKDAAKLQALDLGPTTVWVVGLDFSLPAEFLAALRSRIAPPRHR